MTEHLCDGTQLDALMVSFVATLKEQVPNLVSFLESEVDQAPWERASAVRHPIECRNDDTVEADFL